MLQIDFTCLYVKSFLFENNNEPHFLANQIFKMMETKQQMKKIVFFDLNIFQNKIDIIVLHIIDIKSKFITYKCIKNISNI